MKSLHTEDIAHDLGLKPHQVEAVIALLEGGATIPFVARYRKEATGLLDEVAISAIRDHMKQLQERDDRRKTILDTIEKQGKLTEELRRLIMNAGTLTALEDLYLPYKPKRRTRGMMAKEKGLEPLAVSIYLQDVKFDLITEASRYIDPVNGLNDLSAVLNGASDIIAEWINENAEARAHIRAMFLARGEFVSRVIKGKEEEGAKFKDYFQWRESVAQAPSHRVLAARRGEKDGFLLLRIMLAEEEPLFFLKNMFLKKNNSLSQECVSTAIEDAYRRLMMPSVENEVRLLTREKADDEAIKTFNTNLKQLLMAAPLGAKVVMAIDPGLRTGCKVTVLDPQGKLLDYQTVYLSQSEARSKEGAEIIISLVRKYTVEIIAIGNGTASRETEAFVKRLALPQVHIMLVNESGASYYSASEVARREFPDLDVSVRGAVSIGRRLQDPLAELVKLDPKNIGVGQYQHDVDQGKLKDSLDDVIISCVNNVGVDLNTASRELLMYVSGVGPALAQALVDARNKQGRFFKREDILKIPRFSAKVYEQAAGFLRVNNSVNPLDASAVHPESYPVVEAMAKSLNCSVPDLLTNPNLRSRIKIASFVTASVGLPTLQDILTELAKPGRDPRAQFELVTFKEGINSIDDLALGIVLTGIVTNITDFGIFVDTGIHQDGLVHISEMSDRYVKHPADMVALQQKVIVKVKDIDIKRRRIALTMKNVSL